MSESVSVKEILELLAKQSGITKKLAAQVLHTIPGIIEEGLKKDGEVRVKGLGTFRLKQVKEKTGRNPKTGEKVIIPPHTRMVFLPEQSFKDYINRDYRLLSYKIIPSAGQVPSIEESTPEPGPERIEQFQYPEQFQTLPQPAPETETELEPEPEPPSRKRRIHWIVPAAISVIIILSLIFYFRNFYHSSPRSSVASRQPEVVSQQSPVSSQQSAVSSQNLEDSIAVKPVPTAEPEGTALDTGRQLTVGSQQAVEPAQNSELRSRNSELRTVTEGQHLFRLAREIYGNPYLWVIIYRANTEKITDPDMLIQGRELTIPVLEGAADHLTRSDSLAVSDGYRLVYEYFSSIGDPRANDFLKAMERYKPD